MHNLSQKILRETMNLSKTIQRSVTIPREINEKLKILAKLNNRTVSNLISLILEDFLNEENNETTKGKAKLTK